MDQLLFTSMFTWDRADDSCPPSSSDDDDWRSSCALTLHGNKIQVRKKGPNYRPWRLAERKTCPLCGKKPSRYMDFLDHLHRYGFEIDGPVRYPICSSGWDTRLQRPTINSCFHKITRRGSNSCNVVGAALRCTLKGTALCLNHHICAYIGSFLVFDRSAYFVVHKFNNDYYLENPEWSDERGPDIRLLWISEYMKAKNKKLLRHDLTWDMTGYLRYDLHRRLQW